MRNVANLPSGERRCKSCGQVLPEGRQDLYAPWDAEHRFPAPLYERLGWYQYDSPEELWVLRAMVQWCPKDGSILWPSVPHIALDSKISKRQIYYLLRGRAIADKVRQGFLERRVLTLLAPANGRRPATYRLNEGALPLDPTAKSILERAGQMRLPGVRRPAKPGEPITPAPEPVSFPVHSVHATTIALCARWAPQSIAGDAQGAPEIPSRAHCAPELNDDLRTPTPIASLKSSSLLGSGNDLTMLEAASPDNSIERGYIRAVRKLFEARPIIQATFSEEQQQIAAELFRNGVSLEELEHAIQVTCVRKYISAINARAPGRIVSLSYFQPVIQEIREGALTPAYLENAARRLPKLEKQWLELKSRAKGEA